MSAALILKKKGVIVCQNKFGAFQPTTQNGFVADAASLPHHPTAVPNRNERNFAQIPALGHPLACPPNISRRPTRLPSSREQRPSRPRHRHPLFLFPALLLPAESSVATRRTASPAFFPDAE